MLGDFSCYGNITVRSVALKEHRSCTRGLGGFPFDVKCFAMGRLDKCFGPVCVLYQLLTCVRGHEQQLHGFLEGFFFPPGVVWNVRDRCVAFYRELDDLVFNLVFLWHSFCLIWYSCNQACVHPSISFIHP